jgi:uncharacterized repeat protein (TIGR01451 family)
MTQQPFTITASADGVLLAHVLTLHFQGSDLLVSMSGPSTGIVGQEITYTLSVRNQGIRTAQAVVLTDTLPAQVVFVQSSGLYSATQSNSDLIWQLGDLGIGESINLSLVGVISPAAALDTILANQIAVATSSTESDLANNAASVSTHVVPGYLFSTSLSPSNLTSSIGGTVTFQINVKNTGNLPDRFELSLSGLNPAGYNLEPASLLLAPGQSAQATLNVLANDCNAIGNYPLTVTVASMGGGQSRLSNAQLKWVSNPIQSNLLPADRVMIGSTSAFFSWQTAVSTTNIMRIWPSDSITSIQTYTATSGRQPSVLVNGLTRNTDYKWYAHSESACGVVDSPVHTFQVGNGIVFTQRGYSFNVARDYDQRFNLAVTNQDNVSHTLLLSIDTPGIDDVIVGFTGSGSSDEAITLQPGETRSATLAIHTQDAQARDYQLIAQLMTDDGGAQPIQDTVPVNVHVNISNVDFILQETGVATDTLVHSFRLTNHGDSLTDLALTVNVLSGTGTLYLTPGMAHGRLSPGQSFDFEAYPAIESDFQGLAANIVATAAGVTQMLPVTLSLPEGKAMYQGEVDNVSLDVSNRDWYCTNRPVIDNILNLPNGFRRADVASAQLNMSLIPQSNVRPHDLAVSMNNNALGGFQNLIPSGLYTYSVSASYLNEAAYGPTTNDVQLKTTHLNGGHYVVATDLSLGVCLDRYREWVVADSQASANAIVGSRSYIIPAPQTLGVQFLAPADGSRLLADTPTQITVRVVDDIQRSWSYIVTLQTSDDNGGLILYDDGFHSDGAARDGIYGGTWRPVHAGTAVLTAQADSCSLVGSATLTVTVRNPAYVINVDHQVALSDVVVLSNTWSPVPLSTIFNEQQAQISWQHTLTASQPLTTAIVQTQLPHMRAGEVRQVAIGTVVSYMGESGSGQIQLGPLFVAAPHIVALTPLSQTVAIGASTVYQVELYNPSSDTRILTPIVTGLPSGWAGDLSPIVLPAGSRVTFPLTITVPPNETTGPRSFAVVAQTDTSGQDQAGALLNVAQLLAVQIDPPMLIGTNGQAVTYTVAITNFDQSPHDYALSTTGLSGNAVSLPAIIHVAASSTTSVPMAIAVYADRGPHPFTVNAKVIGSNTIGRADAVLVVTGDRRLATTLSPTDAAGGPDVPTLYRLTLTNTGSLSDTYAFNVTVPKGWSYQITANGAPIDRLSLTPFVFNSTELWLIVTPSTDALTERYRFNAHVRSENDPNVATTMTSTLTISGRGVQVEIVPEHTTLNPAATGTWQVVVTNTGSLPDSYSLMAGGIVSASAQFVPAAVSLAPGEAQTIQLTSRDMDFALPQTYPFAVTALSASDVHIQNFDTADITFSSYEAVQVELLPASQMITDSVQASYLMVITNTGNTDTVYQLSANTPSLAAQWDVEQVYVPAHMTAGVLLTVRASEGGTYAINATATSLTSLAQASATASLTIAFTNRPPVVDAGIDQLISEGDTVQFKGSFTDADVADTHTIEWNFGDGTTATDTLTPSHTYPNKGVYSVILTIADSQGAVGSDTLVITVNNAVPHVNAGPDQIASEGEWVHFAGAFDDPGISGSHTIEWDFGDGLTMTSTLTPTHLYADNGVYTVTLAITDADGAVGVDELLVTVNNAAPMVNAGSDQTMTEGAAMAFNGTFTDLGILDTHTIDWNFGDGTTTSGSLTPSHVYANDGVYTVTLTITDKDGGVGRDGLSVTVNNVAPIVDAGADRVATEGDFLSFTGTFTDPGTLDTYAIQWNFGDGTTASGTLLPTHEYVYDGVFTVTLTIIDSEGGMGSDTLEVVVGNASPIVNAGSDQMIDEGDPVDFVGAFTDPGIADTHQIYWDFGDGRTTSDTLTPVHVYADNGIYTVRLTVMDDRGAVGADTLLITVNNIAPLVSVGPNQVAHEGETILLTGTFTDPGTLDTHTITWDFGDGSTANGILMPTHIYADNGVYTATLTVTDKDGASGIDQLLVTVSNVAPQVNAGSDQMTSEGSLVDFTGTFTDPGALDTHTINWDFGDGETTTNTLTPTHGYADNGVYTVTLTATDEDGDVTSDSLTVSVYNVAPIVVAGPDLAAIRYETVPFNGSFTDPGLADTHLILWSFGDGTTLMGTLSPTHVYSQSGVYTVTLAVLDDDGGLGADILHVFVTNVAPAVDAGPNQDADEGASFNFHGTFTGTGTLDRYDIAWDFGDGTTATGTLLSTHVYADDGLYTVTLTIADDDGLVSSDALHVAVHNVAPTAHAGPNQTTIEGQSVLFNGTFTDPGILDTHFIRWNFSDGGMADGTLTPTHVYVDNGVYTVTLIVIDDDGGLSSDQLLVTVENDPPNVDAGSNQVGNEGQVIDFNGTFTDTGTLDSHTFDWNFGDGATMTGTLTPSHLYADNGVYTVTLTVTDKDGGVSSDTLQIIINNVAPTVDAGQDVTTNEGESVTFTGTFSDPGTLDTHTIEWNYGDGSTATGSLTTTHVYANNGIYTVTLAVTDKDGGVGRDMLIVTVNNVAPTVDSGSNVTTNEGDNVHFAGTFTDPGVLDTQVITWTFGDGATATGILTPTHLYADNGVYTATLAVADNDGGHSRDSVLITVYNLPPIVNAGPDQTTVEGSAINFNGSFIDPGRLDTHTFYWQFGDGATASGTLTPTHIYTHTGVFTVTLTVTDKDGAMSSDTLRVTTISGAALYPIALHRSSIQSVTVGQLLPDIYNGVGQGNFGWLSWTGANGEPVLVQSLTPPGDSQTYINPNNSNDHTLSNGDWVYGRPGVANSKGVRDALDALKALTISVPVWDTATGQGNNTRYHIIGCARIQITDYLLPGQDRISAIYRGMASCQ